MTPTEEISKTNTARYEQLSHLIDNFRAFYEGDPWFGNSMLTVLEPVTARQARTRPLPNVHSIAELVWHMIYWRTSLIKKLEGDFAYKASMEDENNWRPLDSLRKITWEELKDEFRKSQDRIIALLSERDDSLLSELCAGNTTFRTYINGMLQHDVYHLAQIALVKKMVAVTPQ